MQVHGEGSSFSNWNLTCLILLLSHLSGFLTLFEQLGSHLALVLENCFLFGLGNIFPLHLFIAITN